MDFEWDEDKNEKTEALRGINFAFATRVFEGRTIEELDNRADYGEVRMRATGVIDGAIYAVVYTDRGRTRRIISVRVATRKERRRWQSFG